MPAATPSYVGFWFRFLAFLIDSLVASMFLYPLSLLYDPALAMNLDPTQTKAVIDELLTKMVLEMLLIGMIFIAFWIYFGSSPGKMLFKGFIVDARTLGPASRKQLLLRYLGYYVSLLSFGLGFFWIGLDRRKQGWHDKLADTLVVNQQTRDAFRVESTSDSP